MAIVFSRLAVGGLILYVGAYAILRARCFEWKEQSGRTGYVVHLHRLGAAAKCSEALFGPAFKLEKRVRNIELTLLHQKVLTGIR